MSVSKRLMVAMILLLSLPLGVVTLTAIGLGKLDLILQSVAEEYAEVRSLQPIDRDLTRALVVLQSGDPLLQATARECLTDAEAALVRYLATQYDSIASEEHQATESRSAASLLRQLQDLLSIEGQQQDQAAQAAAVIQLRKDLEALHAAADSGVQRTHQAAILARESTLSLAIIASLVSTAVCIMLVNWSTRSVNRRLRELHQRLAAHAPGAPVKAARGLGGVVSQIEDLNNQMLQKIEVSGRELLRRERLVGIGLLAADVAHEINNPMNAMLGLSELGLKATERGPLDDAARTELRESLRVMRREALRCKAIVERLMAMVRTSNKPGWFDATRLVQETVQVAQAARPDRALCFVITGENLIVSAFGPANDVRQILLTLLINAADAIGPNGRIEADATKTEQEVWLRVRDNGRGFTEEMRQTFFTPFKSYSEHGKGAGLGLSIAQALAEGMGASLRPFSEGLGSGSMFILAIPIPEDDQ